MFPTFAFMSHSCDPNGRHIIQEDGSMHVLAQRHIQKGQEVRTLATALATIATLATQRTLGTLATLATLEKLATLAKLRKLATLVTLRKLATLETLETLATVLLTVTPDCSSR